MTKYAKKRYIALHEGVEEARLSHMEQTATLPDCEVQFLYITFVTPLHNTCCIFTKNFLLLHKTLVAHFWHLYTTLNAHLQKKFLHLYTTFVTHLHNNCCTFYTFIAPLRNTLHLYTTIFKPLHNTCYIFTQHFLHLDTTIVYTKHLLHLSTKYFCTL